jgi:hypothetical protein
LAVILAVNRQTRFCRPVNRNGVHIARCPFVCRTEWRPRKR